MIEHPRPLTDSNSAFAKRKTKRKALHQSNLREALVDQVKQFATSTFRRSAETSFLHKLQHLQTLPVEKRPELVSSATGKIDKVLMSFNLGGGGIDDYDYAEKLEELMAKLPDAQFILFGVDPRTAYNRTFSVKERQRLFDRVRAKFIAINEQKSESDKLLLIHSTNFSNFDIWIQDPFVVFKDKKSLYLTEPFNFEGSPMAQVGEEKIAEIVAEQLTEEKAFGIKVKQCKVPFYFEGGNILADDNFVLIGKDHIQPHLSSLEQEANPDTSPLLKIWQALKATSPEAPPTGRPENKRLTQLLQKVFGPDKTVIVVGNGFRRTNANRNINVWSNGQKNEFPIHTPFQPLAHLDLFMTLAGKDKEGRYVILIADPELPQFEQNERLKTDFLIPFKSRLDEIELLLKSKTYTSKDGKETAFRIVRNRVPFVSRSRDSGARKWYPLYYNNCLVEVTSERKKVWYPTFLPSERDDWPFLETYNDYYQKLWKETLAFDEAHPMSDYFNLAKQKGALHCMVKVLNRV